MADAFTEYQAIRRFSCLDGVRFFCIIAVIWHHSPLSVQYMANYPIAGRGFLGVDFFFVLSGFLITTLLLREEARQGRFSVPDFYKRRILRILPVYFFVVTLVGFYYIFIKHEQHWAGVLPYYYLFLSNFIVNHIPLLDPTWSLSVEEQYYMIWPLLLLLLPRRAIVPVLIGLIALNVVVVSGGLDVPTPVTKYLIFKLPTATYAPILIGSLLAIGLNTRGFFTPAFHVLGHRLAPVICICALLLMVALAPADVTGLPNLVIHLLMAICLATLVMRDDNILTPLLTIGWLSRIGQISYGLYLYHLIALFGANVILTRLEITSEWMVLALYSVISVIMAELSFRTLEAYFQNLRSH